MDWKVLLIGGSSGTGKTTLARKLSLHFQIPLIELDDIRIALQKVGDQNKYPELFYYPRRDELLLTDFTEVLKKKIARSSIVQKALTTIVENHTIYNIRPVIIEGDDIIPEFVAASQLKDTKTIFLYDSYDKLLERELSRFKEGHVRGGDIPLELRIGFIKLSDALGKEVKKQAENYHYPMLCSSPIASLQERVLSILEK